MKYQRMRSLAIHVSSGFTLMEVLIALVVLSLGVLGIAKLMLVSVKLNDNAYMQTQATNFAYAIIDHMRANRVNAEQSAASGYYVPALQSASSMSAPNPDCSTALCNPQQAAQYDVYQWLLQLGDPARGGLPSGQGQIALTSNAGAVSASVTVQWDDSVSKKALGISSATTQSTTLVTVL